MENSVDRLIDIDDRIEGFKIIYLSDEYISYKFSIMMGLDKFIGHNIYLQISQGYSRSDIQKHIYNLNFLCKEKMLIDININSSMPKNTTILWITLAAHSINRSTTTCLYLSLTPGGYILESISNRWNRLYRDKILFYKNLLCTQIQDNQEEKISPITKLSIFNSVCVRIVKESLKITNNENGIISGTFDIKIKINKDRDIRNIGIQIDVGSNDWKSYITLYKIIILCNNEFRIQKILFTSSIDDTVIRIKTSDHFSSNLTTTKVYINNTDNILSIHL